MSKKSWYTITAQADGDESQSAEIHIYDYIGEWGVSARGFVSELKNIDAAQIDLHINSPGGSVVDGVAIQNALKQHSAKVTTYIDGLAGSIASIIALAGDEIQIADNAYVMIHNPASIVFGEAADMLKEAEVLNKMADGLAGDYSRKMGITVEEARALMDEETWYLGEEAVDAGFADSTYTGTPAVASFDAKRFTAKAPAEAIKRFTQSPKRGNPQASVTPKTKVNAMTEQTTTEAETEVESVSTEGTATESAETTEASSGGTQAVQEAVQAALAEERRRTAEITAVGSKFGFTADAEKFISSGKSVEDFRAHVLGKSPEDWKASLQVKNPAVQAPADDNDDSEGADAVAKIKERRKAKFA